MLDVAEFLDALGARLTPAARLGGAAAGRVAAAVAYHDACHLAHAQGDPRCAAARCSRALPNLRLVEIADGEICCGSAGIYNVEHADIASELGRRKAEAVRSTGARWSPPGTSAASCRSRARSAATSR